MEQNLNYFMSYYSQQPCLDEQEYRAIGAALQSKTPDPDDLMTFKGVAEER